LRSGTAPFRDDSHPCHFSAVGLLFLAESFLKIQLHAISEFGAQRDREGTVAGCVRSTLVLLSKSILCSVVVSSSRIAVLLVLSAEDFQVLVVLLGINLRQQQPVEAISVKGYCKRCSWASFSNNKELFAALP